VPDGQPIESSHLGSGRQLPFLAQLRDHRAADIPISGRNILGTLYYGFTEPDPDGNSYQPAPTAEWAIGLRMGIGRK